MTIGHRVIGYDHDPLVIAEIGINHGGSLGVAKAMVDAAIGAGAEIIKHQTHVVDDEMSPAAMDSIPGNADESIYEIMSRCSLSEEDERALMQHVQDRGGIFISTPFSRAALERLIRFDVPAFKVGSGECNNYPLLEHIASVGKPVILSTGMNDLKRVSGAVDIFRRHGIKFALLHTTNLYPTPPHLVRLGAMTQLGNEFHDAVIGLSDHTRSNLACLGAVALGASILERHFTDSLQRPGPDIACSMDPESLSDLIADAALMRQMRGGDKSKLLEEEEVTRRFAFATVVAIQNIPEGAVLSVENVWVKRPGTGGIRAEEFDQVLGRRVRHPIQRDTHLSWGDLS